jgi:hypothetical protein
MTPVAVIAIADIVLIVLALAIVLGSKASQRRELRRSQPTMAAAKPQPSGLARVYSIEPR